MEARADDTSKVKPDLAQIYRALLASASPTMENPPVSAPISAQHLLSTQLAAFRARSEEQNSHHSVQALIANRNRAALQKHFDLIENAKQLSFEKLMTDIGWLQSLEELNSPSLPITDQASVFDSVAANEFLTAEQKAELLWNLMPKGYEKFSAELFKIPCFNFIIKSPTWFEYIGKKYLDLLCSNQTKDLEKIHHGITTIEEIIWARFITNANTPELPLQILPWLLKYYPDQPLKILNFIQLWHAARADTPTETLNIHTVVDLIIRNTPFASKHDSLVMKIAKQSIFEKIFAMKKLDPSYIFISDEKLKSFLAEHRNSPVNGGYGETASINIYHLLVRGHFNEAERLYLDQKEILATQMQALQPMFNNQNTLRP